MKNAPSQLRMRRLALGLRIRDVAKSTGLSDSRVSLIEREEARDDIYDTTLINEYLADQEGHVSPHLVTSKVVGLA